MKSSRSIMKKKGTKGPVLLFPLLTDNNHNEEYKKSSSGSTNMHKQGSCNSNFSLCSMLSQESPSVSSKSKPSSVKHKDQTQAKSGGIANAITSSFSAQNNAKMIEEDPILRDLQASIQAGNEIREIFNKKKQRGQEFKPPILFNNYQKKPSIGASIQHNQLPIKLKNKDGFPFSPPKRLHVNPIVRDRRFQ